MNAKYLVSFLGNYISFVSKLPFHIFHFRLISPLNTYFDFANTFYNIQIYIKNSIQIFPIQFFLKFMLCIIEKQIILQCTMANFTRQLPITLNMQLSQAHSLKCGFQKCLQYQVCVKMCTKFNLVKTGTIQYSSQKNTVSHMLN